MKKRLKAYKMKFRFKLDLSQAGSMMMRMALSYSAFLFLCLILSVCIFNTSAKNSRDKFWRQNHTIFSNAVMIMDGYLGVIDSYCRQLSRDDSFYRLANMTSNEDTNFYFTALQNKKKVSTYLFSPAMVPVDFYYIYLHNTDYILSNNQFESDRMFYNGIGMFEFGKYDGWHEIMKQPLHNGKIYDMSEFTLTEDGKYMYILDMDELTYRNIPATVCFRLSFQKLSSIFQDLSLSGTGYLLVVDQDGQEMFSIKDPEADMYSPTLLSALSYSGNTAFYTADGNEKMHVTRHISDFNDWQYYLVQPEAFYFSQTKDYTPLFRIVLFSVTVFGLIFIVLLARRTIQPVIELDDELKQTISDKESLEREIEDQKPIIRSSYVRQLMLGALTSSEEVTYMRDYLELSDPSLHFNVLYAVVYHNNSALCAKEETSALITEALTTLVDEEMPFYVYMPEERIYALLICTHETADASLLHLQAKVLQLHNELLEKHDIWLFAGLGQPTDRLMHIWESYQQAQEAANNTAKHYIFLPYEVIHKSSDAFYYPPELSTKLLHFITMGNKAQVLEIFNLIHKENMEERSLPNNLLKFLFSDIRNTLLRARFMLNNAPADKEALLSKIDRQLNDHLSFKLCEDIAINLCDAFSSGQDEPDLIRTIVNYIRENYRDPSISLNKISDEFHISESYFSHMFKEKCGVNFSFYLEDLRLNEAARLIRDTDCSVSELYLQVGYNNPNSFRRAFKKKFDVLPSAFKNG